MLPLFCLAEIAHGAMLNAATHRAAHPALRLGGEWAGHRVTFSADGVLQRVPERFVSDAILEWGEAPAGFEVLTTEKWDTTKALARRSLQLLPEDGCNCENLGAVVSNDVLPTPCSGSTQLRPGNSMMEPETLNVRAWALDAVEAGDAPASARWTLETCFDGVGGVRPRLRRGALECPAERTRVQCTFDVTAGALVGDVHVWQERCWSASPSDDLQPRESGRSGLDAAWVSSAVGLDCFGEGKALPPADSDGDAPATVLSVAGGIELTTAPGLLEVTLRSGPGCRNSWSAVTLRRSWAGDDAGRSMFTEVETFDETMGDD